MEEQMKLHKIITSFFLILFLMGFAPTVFASDAPPEGCTSTVLTPGKAECVDKCQDNSSWLCRSLLNRGANTNSDDLIRAPASEEVDVGEQSLDKAVDVAAGKAKDGAKDWIKKKLFGDPAAVQDYNQKLVGQFQAERNKCVSVRASLRHSISCVPNPMECRNTTLDQTCGKEIPVAKFAKLEGEAQNKIAGLAQTLAGKLNVNPNEIMGDIKNQTDTNCGKAWHLAQLTCQFPVQALGGKVTKALNVIGKVAMGTQMVAGLAGKSLNDLCKALTTLSGAGVTIAMLARAKCAFAMRRCNQYCNMEKYSQPGYCNQLYQAEEANCGVAHTSCRTKSCNVGAVIVPCFNCSQSHTSMEQYACKVEHINKMKSECGLLKKNTMAMMGDIVQLIATVKSAKMCWDKTGGDMSSSIDPETCRKMGGTPYKDETTGDQRCRFRDPGEDEGVCPPYGVPVSCNQACEDGSVPAGCDQGVCENGEMVSCTNTCPNGSVPAGCHTCPDPSLTYPNCDCNCPEGQSCNSDRQCVVDNGGGSCNSTANCGTGQVCQNGMCVSEGSEDLVNADGFGGDEPCNSSVDCGESETCQSGVCVANSCECQGEVWPCDQQCGGRCLEESVNCPCAGDGECTPPQKCVTSTDGQNVCSDDDGEGVCPDGSRVACDQTCSDGSSPANCRACHGDNDCEENQICNRGVCTPEDPVLSTDGAGGGGAPDDGLDDEMAITNDGMGGGGGGDPNNTSNNIGSLPGASSGKPGLFARLGALLGIKGGGGLGSSNFGRGRGSSKIANLAKDEDVSGHIKGTGHGGFGGYGSGGGGALNPATGGLGFGASQIKKQKDNKRTAFPTNLGNIGGVHQDIFKAVTKRYQKIYKLK